MWSRSHALLPAVLAGSIALALAGCGIQPMYGGTTAGGAKLAEVMSAVDVTPIPGRVGQRVRNELIFEDTGGGNAPLSRYRLDIVVAESVTNQLVQITGNSTGQVYQLTASFKLVNLKDNKVMYQGAAISRAPYSRFQEIFANVRARYDAENRAARTVAESIKTQVATFLANAA
jgi:LPS-assembly lipoprotein